MRIFFSLHIISHRVQPFLPVAITGASFGGIGGLSNGSTLVDLGNDFLAIIQRK